MLPAIRVDNLSKLYRMGASPTGLQDLARPLSIHAGAVAEYSEVFCQACGWRGWQPLVRRISGRYRCELHVERARVSEYHWPFQPGGNKGPGEQ